MAKLDRRDFLFFLVYLSASGAALLTPGYANAKNGGDDGGGDDGNGDDSGGHDGAGDDNGGRDDHGGRQSSPEGRRSRAHKMGGDENPDIGIGYADGTQEHLKHGIYERIDASGRVLERRKATWRDRQRLQALERRLKSRRTTHPPTGASVSHAVRSGGDMEIHYADGWHEEIARGIYLLTDPRGNTVTRRKALPADTRRMRKTMAER